MYNSFTQEVTGSATRIALPDTGNVSDQVQFGIQNLTGSGGDIYIGGVNVATSGASKGWKVAAGESFSGSCIRALDAPYLVASVSSVTVTILTNG